MARKQEKKRDRWISDMSFGGECARELGHLINYDQPINGSILSQTRIRGDRLG